MFPRTIGFGNPFQQFASNPFQGVNPFATSNPAINPSTQLGPLTQLGAPGINPYAGVPYAGVPGFNAINPLAAMPFGWGVTPNINPLVAAQLASINPALLSQLAVPPVSTQSEFGSPYNAGQFNPAAQLLGGVGHFAGQPYGAQTAQPFAGLNPHLVAQTLANPAIASDPLIGALVAQQLNPLAQQQLPIRPLIGGHQFNPQLNPLLSSLGAGFGAAASPSVDPYSTLMQAQLISQLATSPYQQLFRAYTGAPWSAGSGLPWGQGSQTAQGGLPFGI